MSGQAHNQIHFWGGVRGDRARHIFEGNGKEQSFGGSCLRYYAYRKMIVAKIVFDR